jgi:Domain of unknown function (DU1801)
MAEAKTKPTEAGVESYLDTIADEARRSDCKQLVEIMSRVTACKPVMWGASIVGFDRYHYRYASGHEGDACVIGFSSRKGDISIYVAAGVDGADDLLAKLGRHKMAKACLYVRRMTDIHVPVLEQLLTRAVAHTRERHPD